MNDGVLLINSSINSSLHPSLQSPVSCNKSTLKAHKRSKGLCSDDEKQIKQRKHHAERRVRVQLVSHAELLK